MTSNYRAGADLERAARKVLEENGYFVVRSAGSKGPVDLVAFKPGEVLFVQCKTWDARMSGLSRREFYWIAYNVGAKALLCSWRKTGSAARQPDFNLVYPLGGLESWSPDYALEPEEA
jgi:Holliday junction resolvase